MSNFFRIERNFSGFLEIKLTGAAADTMTPAQGSSLKARQKPLTHNAAREV